MSTHRPPVLQSLRRALWPGATIGLLTALAMCAWELIENPGGVFRQSDGLHWGNLLETAWSWFLPVFLAATAGACVVYLCIGYWRPDAMAQTLNEDHDGR